MIALKKATEDKFIVIKKDEMKPLELKDTIIFVNPKDLQNYDFGNNVKGISFRYAVVK